MKVSCMAIYMIDTEKKSEAFALRFSSFQTGLA